MQVDMKILLEKLYKWAKAGEKMILEKGFSPKPDRLSDATRAGVTHVERIRLLPVKRVPGPGDPILVSAMKQTNIIPSESAGLTLGYGIYVNKRYWNNRELLVHEFVHTSQYERLGGLKPFLNLYVSQCLSVGYYESPLELEAVETTKKILNGESC